MQILIKSTIDEKNIILDVKPSDTIKTIKTKIEEKEKIPQNQQILIFVGYELLENDKTLTDYKIQEQSTLYLALRRREGKAMKIAVNILSAEKIINLDVESVYTMEEVKKKIEEKEGIPIDQHRLVYAGKELKNDQTFEDYNLKEGNTLYLIPNDNKTGK